MVRVDVHSKRALDCANSCRYSVWRGQCCCIYLQQQLLGAFVQGLCRICVGGKHGPQEYYGCRSTACWAFYVLSTGSELGGFSPWDARGRVRRDTDRVFFLWPSHSRAEPYDSRAARKRRYTGYRAEKHGKVNQRLNIDRSLTARGRISCFHLYIVNKRGNLYIDIALCTYLE